jgi:hypothetical protein
MTKLIKRKRVTLRHPAEGAMARGKASPVFTDRDVTLIASSLPDAVDPQRLKLLPRVLREWSRNELREYLSREPRAIILERAARVEAVGEHAQRLLEALGALDDRDRYAIVVEMLRVGEHLRSGMSPWDQMSEASELLPRIKEENSFLGKLAAAAPAAWKRGRGGPRNIIAYLVMKDAGAIFKWLTGMDAKRQVDRDTGKETGPFWRFAKTIWPVVFGKAEGLSSAMKNWESYRKKYGEGCALIANIAMRHPTWGLFER